MKHKSYNTPHSGQQSQVKNQTMKRSHSIYFIFFLLAICVLTACNKKKLAYKKANQIITCSRESGHDSLRLANLLVGRWQWLDQKSEKMYQKADRDVFIDIQQQGVLIFHDADMEAERGTWSLSSGFNTFRLENNLGSEFLSGDVYLCADDLIITMRDLDGLEHRYQRSKTE